MTKHEFIFSHQPGHRIARHVIFWFLWSLAFNILFHFPIHVFKGWDVSGPGTKNYQELGPVLFFIKSFLVNSFLAVIAPQIIFIYAWIYWLFPLYFHKRKNYFLSAISSIFVVIAFYFIAVSCKHSTAIYNNIVHGSPLYPFLDQVTLRVVVVDQLTSLPMILGIALMIKLIKKWWLKQRETEQLAKEKTKVELQLLKAQVHPHFLFNTISNIYFFMLSNSSRAPEMIKKLSGLLSYILKECDPPLVPLEKEIKMIRDYMTLEKIRYAEQMNMTIEIEGDCKDKMIAPLLLIPFVENSFKHGASKLITPPVVRVKLRIENNSLYFMIMNNKPLTNTSNGTNGNIGLKNVKKRLELLYGNNYELNIVSEAEIFTVYLSLQLHDLSESTAIINQVNTRSEYAVA